MDMFSDMIEGTHGPNPYPSCRCWGFIDGLRLTIFNPDDIDVQNFFYNGWVKVTGVVNIFIYTPDGKICAASMNNPGSTQILLQAV